MGCWSWQYRSSTALVCSQHSADVGSLSEGGVTPSEGMAPPPVLSRAPPYPGEAASAGGLPARLAASLAASPPSAGAEVSASASSAVWPVGRSAVCAASWERRLRSFSACLRRCRGHSGLPAGSAADLSGWSSSVAFVAAADLRLRLSSVESCG